MKRPLAIALAALAPSLAAQPGSVVDTPHNLSVSGPGPIRAASEDRVCIFCHTPHGARATAPLWNRNDSTASYLPYDSPTLDADPGQPTGSSKLCLSCHDGTIALGSTATGTIAMAGGVTTLPPGHGLIGTDLRDDHPISFTPVFNDPALTPPSSWHPMELDAAGEFQCTSCHDPHDNTYGEFLRMDNTDGAMCQICHQLPGWEASSHQRARAPAGLRHTGRLPGGCGLCHTPHGAGSTPLLQGAAEEAACLACHSAANPDASDIASLLRQPFGHFVDRHSGEHSAEETPADASGHVECADCHDPHEASDRPSISGLDIGGALEGVPGVTLSGAQVDEAQFEYEICLRCHGEEPAHLSGFPVRRQIEEFDLGREIDPGNASFHPIAAPGRNLSVPSLIAPLSEGSVIRCSDCHSAPAGFPRGPHGSPHEGLLRAGNRTGDGVAESPQAYALCYECHSRSSILGDQSFPLHRLHVVDERTSCSVCHDPHGVSLSQGDPGEHTHLINFDLAVVEPEPASGVIAFTDLGERAGSCALTCHGYVHSSSGY